MQEQKCVLVPSPAQALTMVHTATNTLPRCPALPYPTLQSRSAFIYPGRRLERPAGSPIIQGSSGGVGQQIRGRRKGRPAQGGGMVSVGTYARTRKKEKRKKEEHVHTYVAGHVSARLGLGMACVCVCVMATTLVLIHRKGKCSWVGGGEWHGMACVCVCV